MRPTERSRGNHPGVIDYKGRSYVFGLNYDLMHLEIQFLLGILSLAFLAVLIIIIYQRNFNYLYYEAQLDGLTGLFGRQLFFQKGEALLAEK